MSQRREPTGAVLRATQALEGPAVVLEEDVRIPAAAHRLEVFRSWAQSERFPRRGRIDYLDGDLEVDVSPEDLFTHGAVKTAMAATLHSLVAGGDLGHVFVDRARVTSPAAGLSAEPDLVVVLWGSLEDGRARLVPAAGGAAGRFVEIEGAPDLVVEIVSDGSLRKDTERLPRLYARAGVRELWSVDARGPDLLFHIAARDGERYVPLQPDTDGWVLSPVLGARFRLRREASRLGTWRYSLDSART